MRLERSQGCAKGLKRIYQATDGIEAAKALDDVEKEWGRNYPPIAPSWRGAWQGVIPFQPHGPTRAKRTKATL
ncbi:transposase [Pseudorhodobacter sp.]|uniref:transposase n=1 Tax=Pseudorhodobacter sp. TaxID=1934400 RepID=UPI0039E5878D